MSSPTRHPASKSIWLVWILNIFLLGIGNVYASGLSALKWLVIGILIRVFVTHLGVLFGAYVLLSLIGMGEIIAVSGTPNPTKRKAMKEPNYTRRQPKAINAPAELLGSRLKVTHEKPPENLDNLTDEFVRNHLRQGGDLQSAAATAHADTVNNLGYGDIQAGQLTYETAGGSNDYTYDVPALEPLVMPEPFNYDFQQYKPEEMNYKVLGSTGKVEPADFTCPHCGINGQNDFSFCLSCGHAYAIG